MSPTRRLLDLLLAPTPPAVDCPDVATWWPRHRAAAQRFETTIERAIAGGLAADRVGWAFAAGYQAALRALVPALPADTIAALCVTEDGGNQPKAIRTTLGESPDARLVLQGNKRWTTLGPDSGLLLVAAVDTRGAAGERPAIRVVQVPSGTPGVTLEPMPDTRFVPEVPHARVSLQAVSLPAAALLPGDGYDAYVKPFRTVEDSHVSAAVLAYLYGEARRRGWPQGWCERALATLAGFADASQLEARAAGTHLLLAGVLAWSHALVAEATELFARGPEDAAAARWARDVPLMQVAGSARAQRAARAWESVGTAAQGAARP